MIVHYLKSHLNRNLYPPKHQKIKKDVVVTMTTMPARITKIWPTLNSILLQSELPEKIYLWLPKQYKRFEEKITVLPATIENHPLIDIKFIDMDYGPATKLLPALTHFKKSNKKIIVIDDDIIYKKTFLKTMLDFSNKYPDHAITSIGSDIIKGRRVKYCSTIKERTVNVLHGYGGYLIKPWFFTEDVFNYPENLPAAFFQDDVWLSGCLKLQGIKIKMIPHLFENAPQNFFLNNSSSRDKKALCCNENLTTANFLKTWTYFEKTS